MQLPSDNEIEEKMLRIILENWSNIMQVDHPDYQSPYYSFFVFLSKSDDHIIVTFPLFLPSMNKPLNKEKYTHAWAG